MASSNDEFSYQSIQDPESIVKYMEAISEGIKNGRLLFGTRRKKLIFEPNGLLKLDVRAKRKEGKVKMEIKISWNQQNESDESDKEVLEIKAGHKGSDSNGVQ